MLSAQARDLERLATANRLRALVPLAGCDFASNDYLALAGSTLLADAIRAALKRGVPTGSGGSRLLRGNHPEHVALEEDAARLFGSASALYFPTGFAANSALLSTLPQRGDVILHDELIHASAHEGMRLSRAEALSVPHNSVSAFADALRDWHQTGHTGTAWLLVESVYSMDGDLAPLAELDALARKQGAMLVIDEAHATGLFGPEGQGLAAGLERGDHIITLHTLGKALGCEGALLCGPRTMRDFLINRGRGFIFSTAPSPLMAAAARAALAAMAQGSGLRDELWNLVRHAEAALAPLGVSATGSQILPLVLGDDARTMQVAAALQAAGFDVRGIRPPTVPEGTSRLRISITRNVELADIDALAAALARLLA